MPTIKKPKLEKNKNKSDKLKPITTIEMEVAIANHFNVRQNIIVPNVSWGLNVHECDMFIIRPSLYAVEVEIKISKSDLIKDSKKKHTHNSNKIRELYFAIPEYLLESTIEYIPPHAGIFVCKRSPTYSLCINVVLYRKAIINTKSRKLTDKEVLKVAKLGCMRIFTLKTKILKLNNLTKEQNG